jgi:hypothetical protein
VTPWAFALHGDVKSFFFTVFPYALQGEEVDPSAQGIADFRLKAAIEHASWRFDVHDEFSVLPATPTSLGGSASGVALTAPELVDLTWEPDTGDLLVIRNRIDRLLWSIEVPHAIVTLGRQPVSFGAGTIFTPMDVVNPFAPGTIDTEYKPGVDTARLDLFGGVATRASLLVTWVGEAPIYDEDIDPGLDDLILGGSGGVTIGTTDLFGLALLARNEPVLGVGFSGSIGPVGLRGEGTFTVPSEDAAETDPFVRAMLGSDFRPTSTTNVSAEVYLQTFGASDPSGYLELLAGPRYQRGEVWQTGRTYAAVAGAQEITPLVTASAAVIANVEDPSALIAPTVSWSVANEAVLAAGMYAGVGERPEPADSLADSVESEFGLYPVSAFLQMRAYF